MSLNRVELQGGLTRDVEIRSFGWGDIADLNLAVNGTRWDREKGEQVVTTTFVQVEVFGPMAPRCANLNRGDEVYVIGELTQHEREKKDGTKEKKTRVRALQVTLTRKSRGGSGRSPAPRSDAAPSGPKEEVEPF